MSMGSGYIQVGGIEADIRLEISAAEAALARTRERTAAVAAEMQRLEDSFMAGQVSATAFQSQILNLSHTYQQLTSHQEELILKIADLRNGLDLTAGASRNLSQASQEVARSHDSAGSSVNGLSSRMRGLSLALVTASRAGQDIAQAGWAAALNNVEFAAAGAAQAMGSTVPQAMAIGAAAQGLATAVYVVSENWSHWMDQLGVGIPAPAITGLKNLQRELKGTQKELEETAKKSRLSADEWANYENAVKREAYLEKLVADEEAVEKIGGETKDERTRGSAYDEAVRQQGGEATVREALLDSFKKEAEESGVSLEAGAARGMLHDRGINPNEVTREQFTALKTDFGFDLTLEKMQRVLDQGGASFGDQIIKAMNEQKWLPNAEGKLATPTQLTRETMVAGSAGKKDAAEKTASVMDEAAANPNDWRVSKFREAFDANSPEGKAEQDAIKKGLHDNAEADRKWKKEADDLADLQIDTVDEGNARWKRHKEDQARKRKENTRKVRDENGGIDELAESELMRRTLLGDKNAMASLRLDMAAQFMKQGLTPAKADAAAEDITKDARTSAQEKVTKNLLKGPEAPRASEVFSAADLNKQAQAGVGEDPYKRRTQDWQDKMYEAISELARNSQNIMRFKVKW